MANFFRLAGTKVVLTLCCTALLSACNLDGSGKTSEDALSESPPPAAGTTITPSMSGSPASTVVAGQAYSFSPQLEGAATGVTFSIANRPAWASFDSTSGSLTGTPSGTDVGSHDGIAITASNGSSTTTLPTFSISVTAAPSIATTNAVTITWQPPAHNTDGTIANNLAGYNIYHGPSAESMSSKVDIRNPGITSHTVSELGPGTHFFGISVYNNLGLESEMLILGSKTIT